MDPVPHKTPDHNIPDPGARAARKLELGTGTRKARETRIVGHAPPVFQFWDAAAAALWRCSLGPGQGRYTWSTCSDSRFQTIKNRFNYVTFDLGKPVGLENTTQQYRSCEYGVCKQMVEDRKSIKQVGGFIYFLKWFKGKYFRIIIPIFKSCSR